MPLFGKKSSPKEESVKSGSLSKNGQVSFRIPYFDVIDPRLPDHGVPVAVGLSVSYAIEDMKLFNDINGSDVVSDDKMKEKLRVTTTKYVKAVVANVPSDAQIPLVQMERKIMEVSNLVQQTAQPQVERVLGITIRQMDVTDITIDKDDRAYRELKSVTADIQAETMQAQHSLNLSAMKRKQEMDLGGMEQLQAMNLENQRETMRIQREEMQRAARLQTEQTFMEAHQANLNASAPMMPGMKPAAPQVSYMIGVNGQQAGPFDWKQLEQLARQGQLTRQTYVWKQGMANWEFAGNVQELQPLFASVAPPMPGMPKMPEM